MNTCTFILALVAALASSASAYAPRKYQYLHLPYIHHAQCSCIEVMNDQEFNMELLLCALAFRNLSFGSSIALKSLLESDFYNLEIEDDVLCLYFRFLSTFIMQSSCVVQDTNSFSRLLSLT